ncbi:MAG: C1 family peptidase [Euryarchaeota archaeon]|nr:C1 family peptidase [Euryarchaeota archaeon]
MKSKNKKAIGIMLAVIMAVSVFTAVIPSIASESSNTPATTEQTEEMGIEELQQRVYEQGYNYTVAENRITCLSSEERKALCGYKHLKAPTAPLPENVGFVSDVPKVKTEKIVSLPSSYDAMTLGYVTPVKNQICGACWLHGAIADFESDVLINESQYSNLTLDFSEQEVGDCNIWASVGGHNFCEGGNALMTTNYFTKYGAACEACNPYEAAPQTCQDCPILRNVDNWRIITGEDGESQISTIKDAILTYGPVYSTIYASDSGFSAYDGGVYEYWESEETNHAIEIIGWDDSLEAWLIKNSWGTDWGRNSTYPGCGWVAYGAANLGDSTSAISGYKNPGDIIFYHDECGWMGSCVGCGTPTAYGAVRFIPSQDSTLTAVDFWAVDTNMAYEIKIFDTLNTVGSEYTFSNQLGTTQTGTINVLGYYSIPLNTPVQLVSGDDFIVQIKLTTTGWEYPIPNDYCDAPWLNWAAITTSSRESYASCDGSQFEKYGEDGRDIGIRARAEVEVAQPDIWVSPTEFNVTLSQNMVSNETLIIGNNGNGALTYSITDSESTNNPLSSECLSLKKKYANIQNPGPDLVLTRADYDMSIAVADYYEYGRYTEATADEKLLLYGYPYAWSSYATIRLDGTDYYQDSTMDTYVTQTPTIIGDSIKTTWMLPNSMDVSETLTLMPNTTKYHFTVKNNDMTSHSIKIRYLFDTLLAYNDGAPFIVPGVGEVTTEQEYINPVFNYWKATDDLVNPTLTSNCTFVPGNKPYKVQFAYWGDIYDYPFDYAITSGQSITSDTAVGMYWNLGTLSPGETKDVIVYYGIAGAILEAPEIAITSLLTDHDSYSPDQNVRVYVDVGNGGDATLTNGRVAVTINNPSDITIFEDTSSATINPNAVVSTNFTYELSVDATAGTYTVTAEVYDSGMNLLDSKTTNFEVVSGVDWLSESPTSGTVNPSNQTDITVTINTTGLSVGEYYANITIANNDPDENPVIVPVHLTVESPGEVFDTGSGTYPSISGTHTGTIEPSCNVNVSKMYTYPCVGTGGHTEYVRIYGDVVDENKTWSGYTGDYHNITFDSSFMLEAGKTYNYEIRTGSYPQIIHESSKEVTGGTIYCTQFTDANGKTYTDWIPAIRLE